MARPGSTFPMARTRVARFPQKTHCFPHHWTALTLCWEFQPGRSEPQMTQAMSVSSFICAKVSWLSSCPNCNTIIFSLSRAGALKRIQCQISLHSAHPKAKETPHTTQALKCQGKSPILGPEKLQSTLRSIQRANKGQITYRHAHLAEKISATLLFFGTSKKDTKTQYFLTTSMSLFLLWILLFSATQNMNLLKCYWDQPIGNCCWTLIFKTELKIIKRN